MNFRDSKRGLNRIFSSGMVLILISLADMRLKKLKNLQKPTHKGHWTKGIFESLIF